MSDQRPGDDATAAAPWRPAQVPAPPPVPVTSTTSLTPGRNPSATPPRGPHASPASIPPSYAPGDGATTQAHAAPPGPAPTRSRRRHRGATAAITVLSALLVAALGLAGYLWYAADSWRDDSDAWQSQARAQGASVAELQSQVDATTQELEAARNQLATATQRITQLADEKAQLGDENAASQQYLDYQRRVSEAAGVVAEALGRCTDGQAQLITYLRTPDQYDAADLQRFTDEVDALCQQASEANTQLQQELAR